MKILALDASSDHCSVAVLRQDKTFFEVSEQPRSHAQRMLPMVDKLLTSADIVLKDIDLIALTHGPGSFTGIRIAVSVAQGLSYAASIPCLPVSSMDAMAYEYADPEMARQVTCQAAHSLGPPSKPLKKGDVIVTALDARMQEVYWSAFEVAEQGLIERQPPTLSSESDFFALALIPLMQQQNVNMHCIGNAWAIPVLSKAIDAHPLIVCGEFQPSALGVLSILKNSEAFRMSCPKDLKRLTSVLCSAEKLEPLYLRNEVSWKKRDRIRDAGSPIV